MKKTKVVLYIAHISGILTIMIAETIRQAMKNSGVSRYQIAQDTGTHQTVLWRIAHGGSCSLETADVLCEYLGLELKPGGKKGTHR